ncbi:MAG: CapA family protein [bacterium]|nr:CapA family protein [bacterium]
MKAVRPYTIKGHILCQTIGLIARIMHLFKGKKWRYAQEFEENPRTMGLKDLLYFTYKYYYNPPLLPLHSEVLHHFQNALLNVSNFTTELTISLGGDLMPYEMIKPKHTSKIWDVVGPDFFGSDIVFANLETPIDLTKKQSFVPEVMLSNMLFNTNEQTFDIFNGNGKYRGFDILSIANNHSLDMGETGLLSTIDFLKNKNIVSIGAAKSIDESSQPVIIEKNGFKIGFIAYTYSLNQFDAPNDKPWLINLLPLNIPNCDLTLIKQQTETCKNAGAELVLCSLHAGNAYQTYPSKTTVDLFENIFNTCGVDIIIGGHPHNLQPWRNYTFKDPYSTRIKTGFAIYSLADFIAYDIFTWCHLCAYVKLEIGKDSNGQIQMRPTVKPLIMERTNGNLQLQYAEEVFKKTALSAEESDIKILYDACVGK